MTYIRWLSYVHILAIFFLCLSGVVSSQADHESVFQIDNGDTAALISAIHAANDEITHPGLDTISLAPDGLYTLTERVDGNVGDGFTGLPVITSHIRIEGNGAAIERSDSTETPSFRIFTVNAQGNLLLNQVTLHNGRVATSGFLSNLTTGGDGGCLLNLHGTVEIVDSTITNCFGQAYGGSIGNSGSMTIRTSTFTDNVSELAGGAIDNVGYLSFGNLSITDSVFQRNNAPHGGALCNRGTLTVAGTSFSANAAEFGGAVHILLNGSASFISSSFSGNTANVTGGAFFNEEGSLTIEDSTFSSNTSEGVGGAISNSNGGDIRLHNSLFTGNDAEEFGGAFINFGTAIVTDCTFETNTCKISGGAIYNQKDAQLDLTYSTLYHNTARYGGGIMNFGGIANIVNSTFSANRAEEYGGGILNAEGGDMTVTASTFFENSSSAFGAGIDNSGRLRVSYSIIANSISGANCDNTLLAGQFTSLGDNLSTDGTCPGFRRVSPQALTIEALLDNGGPTRTHALLPGSIALDAVSDCNNIEDIDAQSQDQRHIQRPQGAACDIGAFELVIGSPE